MAPAASRSVVLTLQDPKAAMDALVRFDGCKPLHEVRSVRHVSAKCWSGLVGVRLYRNCALVDVRLCFVQLASLCLFG